LMIAVKYGYASEANKIKMANKILSESEIQGVHLINWGYPHQDSITFQTRLAASEAGVALHGSRMTFSRAALDGTLFVAHNSALLCPELHNQAAWLEQACVQGFSSTLGAIAGASKFTVEQATSFSKDGLDKFADLLAWGTILIPFTTRLVDGTLPTWIGRNANMYTGVCYNDTATGPHCPKDLPFWFQSPLVLIWICCCWRYSSVTIRFISVGVLDFRRRCFMMENLISLIAVRHLSGFIPQPADPLVRLNTLGNVSSWMASFLLVKRMGTVFLRRLQFCSAVILSTNIALIG